MTTYHYLLASIIFLVSTLILTRHIKSTRRNLPPGPPGWPLVGNLFQFAASRKPFFEYVRALLPKYGPIFTLKMGNRTMIIVSSPSLAHEALIQKGHTFSTRPPENPTRAIFSNNKSTVNAALYGPVWRALRRNMVQNALSPSTLKGFRRAREVAIENLIRQLRSDSDANGRSVYVFGSVRFAVLSILVSMCFGLEMDEKNIDTVNRVMRTVLGTLDPRLDDYLPILRPLFEKQRKRALEVRKLQIETLAPLIEKRREVMLHSSKMQTPETLAYVDTLFDLKIEDRAVSLEDMVSLCSEFINGGTDTTATAIEWGLARLIQNPKIQSEIHDEIQAVNPTVEEVGLESMPYLNAFTKELLRKHPPTYFSLAHASHESGATIGGYSIPKGASLEFFLPAISEDSTIWSEPEIFEPNRFLFEKEVDMTGVRGVKMLPFGAGRRICPGMNMAMIHINSIIARMVKEFEWGGEVDFTEKFDFTVVMKNTLQARIKARV